MSESTGSSPLLGLLGMVWVIDLETEQEADP
jgi:hypothetical protein